MDRSELKAFISTLFWDTLYKTNTSEALQIGFQNYSNALSTHLNLNHLLSIDFCQIKYTTSLQNVNPGKVKIVVRLRCSFSKRFQSLNVSVTYLLLLSRVLGQVITPCTNQYRQSM